jgi:hypothetical protein
MENKNRKFNSIPICFRFRDYNSKSISVLLSSLFKSSSVPFRIQPVPFGFTSDPIGSVRFLFSTLRVQSVSYLKPTRTGFVASLIISTICEKNHLFMTFFVNIIKVMSINGTFRLINGRPKENIRRD